MQKEVLITKSKKGDLLLRVMENSKPKFVSLNRSVIKNLVKALLENSETREAILDEVMGERYSEVWREAGIRRIIASEKDKEFLLQKLAEVGFKPVTIKEEVVQ